MTETNSENAKSGIERAVKAPVVSVQSDVGRAKKQLADAIDTSVEQLIALKKTLTE